MNTCTRRIGRFIALLLAIGVVAACTSGCMLFPAEEQLLAPPIIEVPPVEYKTMAVALTTIENKLIQQAYFTPALASNVVFEYSGRLSEVFAREGAVVEEGDVLATFTTEDIEIRMRDQRYAIERLQLRLNEAKGQGTKPEDTTVYADYDGTIAQLKVKPGDNAVDVQRRYGALGYIIGEESKLSVRIADVPVRLALGAFIRLEANGVEYTGAVKETMGGNSVGLWVPQAVGQSPQPTMAWNGSMVVSIDEPTNPPIGATIDAYTSGAVAMHLGTGKVEAVGGAFTASGQIAEVLVTEGQEVKKGDALLRMEAQQSSSYTIDSINIDLRQAREQLKEMEEAFERSQVISPITGKVTWVNTGLILNDWVSASTSLARISVRESMVLELKGDKALQLPLGLPVVIKVRGVDYTGTVTANPDTFPLDKNGARVRAARFDIDGLDMNELEISEGESANVEAVLERKGDVIVLPKQYVQSFYGRRFVNILEDGVKQERDVELGIETTLDVEITKGLNVGDLVIIR